MSSVVNGMELFSLQKAVSTMDPPNDTKAPRIIAVAASLAGIAAVVVIQRIYVRIWMLRRFGTDDCLMILAMALSFGVVGCFAGESHHGLGRYTRYISDDDQQMLRKYTYFHALIVMIGISTVKVSIGFFLLRVAEQSKFKTFIIGMIVFLVAFTMACAGTLIFQCVPVAASWDLTKKTHAKCFSINTFTAIGIWNSCVNIVTDVIFATLPIPMFYNIQVNWRTKISLMCILSLGYLACASSIVKAVAQTEVLKLKDMYRESTFTTWNEIELNVGIIAASLPTIKPLVKSLLDTTRNGTYTYSNGRSRTRSDAYYRHHPSIMMGSMKASRPGDSHVEPEEDESRKYNVHVTATRTSLSGGSGTSDEILSPPSSSNPPGIMRTMEVYVQRDGRSVIDDDASGRLEPQRNIDDRI